MLIAAVLAVRIINLQNNLFKKVKIMESDNENIPATKKCGYCGCLLKDFDMSQFWKHSCFLSHDEERHSICVDECHVVTMELITPTEEASTSDKGSRQQWNNDWDELLIKEVSQRPALYNYRLPIKDRTNLKIKDLWNEVYNCLGGRCKIAYIEKRWETLKDMYTKAKTEERTYKRSGSAAFKKRKKHSLKLFEMMTFLDDLSKPSRTITSLSSESESQCETEEEEENNEKSTEERNRKIQFYETLVNSVAQPIMIPKVDSTLSFLLSLGPTLRELDEHRRLRVQREFTRIVQTEMVDKEYME